ncbi:MAG: hypothetical protein ACT4NP_08490 [Pseudonocardiales bacterium]
MEVVHPRCRWLAWSARTRAGLARHAEVTHLGVTQPVDDPALDHGPSADAGADGQVHECVQATGGPPAAFP